MEEDRAEESHWKDAENDAFKAFIRSCDSEELDSRVYQIQELVTAATDCTKCGNCCRSLMINVEPEEIQPLTGMLQLSVQEIKNRYIEQSEGGMMIINTIPCHFLSDNKCTVYENRFNECREFPHLHRKGFNKRLFGTFMHYYRCPIIYNTIELLKQAYGFQHEPEHETAISTIS